VNLDGFIRFPFSRSGRLSIDGPVILTGSVRARFLPARRRSIVRGLSPWLPRELSQWIEQARPTIDFQPYDWSLACRVRTPAE